MTTQLNGLIRAMRGHALACLAGGILPTLVAAQADSETPSPREYYFAHPHFFTQSIDSAEPEEVESYFTEHPQARPLADPAVGGPIGELANALITHLGTKAYADEKRLQGEEVDAETLPEFSAVAAETITVDGALQASPGFQQALAHLGSVYADAREQLAEAYSENTAETVSAYRAVRDSALEAIRLAGFSYFVDYQLPGGLEWDDGQDLPEFASPEAKRGGVERIAIQDFPRTLRTVGPDANGAFRNYLLDDNQMRLTRPHPNVHGRYIPALAKEWAIDPDGQTVYYRLDPDARWSDGEPLDADDFLFSGYFFQSPWIIAPWYNDFYSNLIVGIYKLDTHLIAVKFNAAKPDVVYRTGDWSPRPEHFYDEFGPDYVEKYQWRFEPTTGPWVVDSDAIQKGNSININRLDDWWANDKKFWRYRYNPDVLEFSVIRDPAKQVEAFKNGAIDYQSLNTPNYWHDKVADSLPKVENGYIHKATFYNEVPVPSFAIRINTAQPLLNNHDIRMGIAHAINYDKVIEVVYRDEYERMRTCADGYGPTTNSDIEPFPYDVAKAREYFAKAGFKTFNDDGFLVREVEGSHGWLWKAFIVVLFGLLALGAFYGYQRRWHLAGLFLVLALAVGMKLTSSGSQQYQVLEFTMSTGYAALRPEFLVLQEYAQKAGIKLNVEILDGTVAWKKLQEKRHDLHYFAFNVSVEQYPRFWEPYHSDNAYKPSAFLPDGSVNPEREVKVQTNNVTMTADWELDQMINRYRASADMDEITDLSHRMQEWIHEDACWIPAWKRPWYRLGYWRWVRWPDPFNVRQSRNFSEWNLHWIDTEIKEETLRAQDAGDTLEKTIIVDETYRAS